MIVSMYYTKLRSVSDEIQSITQLPMWQGCKCDISKDFTKLRDKERLYEFLTGLNDDFNTFKTQILSIDLLPTLGAAYHLVSQDEQERLIGTARHTT